MRKEIKIRAVVFAIHGALALGLGLAFFYLRATMSNFVYEAFATAIAVLLSAAAFLLAALTDWFAALSEGVRHVHQLAFYLLGGLVLVLAGLAMWYSLSLSLLVLSVLAALHALAFGISALFFAFTARHHRLERRSMYALGTLSILFSGVLGGVGRDFDTPKAAAVLGAYLCFVGVKMIFFAWDLRRKSAWAKQSAQTVLKAVPTQR